MGRKKKTSGALPYRVESRLGERKYRELVNTLQRSEHRTMSALVRELLSNRPIICKTHDDSVERVLEEFSILQMEFHAIGVNINQITRYFNSIEDPLRKKKLVRKVEKQMEQFGKQMDSLEKLLSHNKQGWLSE
ncbi:plasmid mobilization protein [Echinicola rosea]|uniref:Plasmid mobilization relaxosome protein MobC n=1 Tax=Echinicola rosea TaxID=1807691 RepID=A0ABQ1V4F5_9BACT|nr:plasmid mobilization relaxosome protein MobC [Echinicola rosea]GGF38556.1 hypothetical protein GCM10011339_28940 [Echinicola rosea]